MTELEFDNILINRGFVLGSYEELDILVKQCNFIARVRYEDYGPRYCKYEVLSISLRCWHIFIPNYSIDE